MGKVEWPTFNGMHGQWADFNSFATSHLIPNMEISAHHKITILKTQCKGPAADLMRRIDPNVHSFEFAYGLLEERYGDPVLMQIKFKKDVEEIDAPTMQTSSLWTFHDAITASLRALENSNMERSRACSYIYENVLPKLPTQLAEKWALAPATRSEIGNLDYLVDFIKQYTRAIEVMNASCASSKEKSKKSTGALQGTATALIMTTHRKAKCNICNGGHLPRRCPKYMYATIDQRYKLAEDHDLCLRCLKGSHENCDFFCPKCSSDKHHSTLCKVKPQQQQPTVTAEASSEAEGGFQRVMTGPAQKVMPQESGAKQLSAIAKPWVSGFTGSIFN